MVTRCYVLLMLLVFPFLFSGCHKKQSVTYPPASYDTSDPKLKPQQQNTVTVPKQVEPADSISQTLRKHYTSWKGTRYRYGGLSRKGIDCSGFTLLTFKKLFDKKLPRTVREQAKKGLKISKASLQPGDLVFFKTGRVQKHVGIYLEDNLFMHASRSHGVIISKMDDKYWRKRYWQAKRI